MTTSIAFLVGCSQATNTGIFLAFRFLNGVAASGPGTVGAGTIADVMPPEQRGRALGIFSVGPLLGPVLGPIMGGFVSQKLDWRWVFRIIYIAVSHPKCSFCGHVLTQYMLPDCRYGGCHAHGHA